MTTKLTDFQPLQDEVVRLRADNERLQSRLAEVTAQLVDARTELRRLMAAAARRDEADRMRAKLADDREAGHLAEIERLTDELQDCQSRAITALHELHADNERLRAALGFYANIETYRGHGMQDAEIIHDGGQIARRALEKKP